MSLMASIAHPEKQRASLMPGLPSQNVPEVLKKKFPQQIHMGPQGPASHSSCLCWAHAQMQGWSQEQDPVRNTAV